MKRHFICPKNYFYRLLHLCCLRNFHQTSQFTMPISSTNIGPQDVSPTRPPLRTTQTTGHHTLVTAFLNTVMQQGFCDCLFWLEKVVRARPVFFDSFRRSITTVFARCTAPPRPSHTLWPRPRLPEYHGKGSLGDSGASMRFCPAKCCPASLPPPPHHPSEVGSDAVSSAMCLFHRADRLLPRLCIYTKRV